MGCDWRLVASHFNPSSGIAVIHTLRRFYIFMHRTTISHFSCKQGFPTQSRGQHSHGPRFSNKKTPAFADVFPHFNFSFKNSMNVFVTRLKG